MSSPLLKKRKVEHAQNVCVICNEACAEKQKYPTTEQWKDFKDTANEWANIRGKFSAVFGRVNWQAGPTGHYWHKNCKWKMTNKRTLEQATRTFNQSHHSSSHDSISISISSNDESSLSTRLSTGVIHQKHHCIWCMKKFDEKNASRDGYRMLSQLTTWYKIKASVLYVKDPELRTRLRILVDSTTDPLGAQIWYHKSCFKKYLRPAYDPKSEENHVTPLDYEEVKQKFFIYVYEKIIEEGEARTLKSLTDEYENIRINFGIISNIKSSHVKDLLTKEFGNKIGFHEREHQNKSTIVYSRDQTGSYIESAINFWGVNTDEILKEAASRIREGFESKPCLEFPPTLSALTDIPLQSDDEQDDVMKRFLQYLFNDDSSTMYATQILFLSDVLESLITKKPTQLPVMLSMTIHGLTRNKEIIKMLYDAGLGPSYDRIMLLYYAWAYDEFKRNSICPEEIASGIPGTVIIDNDDFKDDDLTGSNTSHRTNMMFVQPERFIEKSSQDNVSLEKCPKDEFKEKVTEEHAIKSYKTIVRGEPSPFEKIETTTSNTAPVRRKLMTHALVRCESDGTNISPEEQKIGAFTGFMSSLSTQEDRSKPYYFLTLPKGPSKSVVFTLMEKAVTAAELKGMPFVQFVGDQPVYTLVEELKGENPEKFRLILPVLGAFHTQAAFMYAIFKRFNGSGIEDILVSAGLLAEGSIEKALKGNHYIRAQRLYKLLYEALARHLITCGRNHGIVASEELLEILDVIRDTECDSVDRQLSFEMILNNASFLTYIDRLFDHVSGSNNHMANFIVSLMQMIEILFLNIDSIRTHNWKCFLDSLRLMMPWFLIYDSTNYGRWLPVYWLNMKSLPQEHSIYMPQIFAQSMTTNPYSALPPDMWIECSMNKGSKLKSGWKRLLRSEKGLYTHVKNANNVNAVRNALTHIFSMIKSKGCHKENVKSRLKVDESVVQDLMELFTEWQCDPFDLENQQLRSLQSGMLSTEKLTSDFESALNCGEEILQKYFDERLFSKLKSIFFTIPKNKRQTFAHLMIPSATNKKESSSEMEARAVVALIELARKKNPSLFHDIWKYRISDHCLAVFNPNGTIRKCQKSKLIDMLKFVEIFIRSYIAVCDMGLLWRLATPTSDDRMKQDGTHFTWHDYAMKVYDLIKARHQNAGVIYLVNDYYGDDVINIKDGEHSSRAKAYFGGESPNSFPSTSTRFPTVNEFKAFFKNNGNKQRLQMFLKAEFARRASNDDITVIYCMRGQSYNISKCPTELIPEMEYGHIEADTAMFYVVSVLQRTPSLPIVIDSEDTDVVALSAYVSSKVNGILGIKRKKSIFDCKQLCEPTMAKIIVRLHVMTGCDSVSSFYGVGKKKVWKNTAYSIEAQKLLEDFSDESLTKFTIRYIYNDKKSNTLAEMREAKWVKMKKKSLARVGIDADTCQLRNKRVRHQVHIFESYADSIITSCPLLNGGYTREGQYCIPIKYSIPPLPTSLSDNITIPTDEPDSDEDEESDGEENDDVDDTVDVDSDVDI